jgi:hypothetical protein
MLALLMFLFFPVGNKCYKVNQQTLLNFHEAMQACSNLGKEYFLVSIHADIENGTTK